MSVTDEIKARIDLVSYVQRHVPGLKKAGRNHKACCPFHNEKTPSFIVNPERQTWHCFGACSEGGDLFTFAEKIHGWDFKEALRELAAEAGIAAAGADTGAKERKRSEGIAARLGQCGCGSVSRSAASWRRISGAPIHSECARLERSVSRSLSVGIRARKLGLAAAFAAPPRIQR